MSIQRTRGVLFVHSAPKALTPHVEWAAGKTLGHAVNFAWQNQPVLPGSLRTEFEWEGPIGSGAGMASALRGWEHLRFEVTEEASPGVDGGRFMHTPDLGVFFAQTDSSGNIVVPENRVRYALEVAQGDTEQMVKELRVALGGAWDDELEAFRHAGDDRSVTWLHRVG